MMNKFLKSAVFFSVLTFTVTGWASSEKTKLAIEELSRLPKADSSWEKVSDDEGVLVHRKSIPGSDVVAFRGETIVSAPLAKVANVLIDTSRKKEWVHRIVEAKDIRNISAFERIEYNHTASGFFFIRDRDFVFRAKASLDRDKNQMMIGLKSVEDEAMPEGSPVRGQLDDSRYILTAIDPSHTHLVVEIHADPKGSVPKWLVNLFQKSWPERTLVGIRNQAIKPDLAEHPQTKAFFDGAPVASSK